MITRGFAGSIFVMSVACTPWLVMMILCTPRLKTVRDKTIARDPLLFSILAVCMMLGAFGNLVAPHIVAGVPGQPVIKEYVMGTSMLLPYFWRKHSLDRR